MGERIFFVDATEKDTGKKCSQHGQSVSTRHYAISIASTRDMEYKQPTIFIKPYASPSQFGKDAPRQKVWNKDEPKVDWACLLSTKSNSYCCCRVNLLKFFKVAETEVLKEQSGLFELLEKMGKQIELNSRVNSKEDRIVQEMMSRHDKHVQDFLSKLEKYGKPETK